MGSEEITDDRQLYEQNRVANVLELNRMRKNQPKTITYTEEEVKRLVTAAFDLARWNTEMFSGTFDMWWAENKKK